MKSLYVRWSGRLGFFLLAVIALVAILAPVISPFPQAQQNLAAHLQPPHWGGPHWLGTDSLGRDLLSRLMYGARLSLFIGVTSVVLSGAIGITLGLLAGYFRGPLDDVVMRLAELQLSFPSFLLAVFIAAVLGPSLRNVIVVLTISSWVVYARVVRSSVLAEASVDYIEAVRATGAGPGRIMFRHLLPNVLPPVIVVAATSVGAMITTEAALSFLGLGVPASVPTWGAILAAGKDYLLVAWWPTTFPGIAILLTVMSVNLIGDWLQRRLAGS
ncbi:MAG TPA: ABC transporter permease [Bacillota bacterium]|nr:ABC transporter permease [Bacillota bacterium]